MKRPIAAAGLLVLSVATAAYAAKPTPTPTPPFVPAFAYYVTSGKEYELRLSNEAGTAAVLVQRSSLPLGTFRFGPANQKTLYYFDQVGNPDQLKKVSWSYNSAGVFVLGTPTYVMTEWASDFDISPDGSKLAYQSLVGEITGDSTFELRVRDLTSGAETLVTTTKFSWDVDWSHDGNWIYLRQRDQDFPDGQHQPYKISRIAAQPNAALEKLATGEVILGSGAQKHSSQGSSQPPGFMLSIRRQEWGLDLQSYRLGFWDGQSTTADGKPQLDFNFPRGTWPSFACDNRKFVYKSYDLRNRPTTNIYNLDTQQILQFSRDANLQTIEWIGC